MKSGDLNTSTLKSSPSALKEKDRVIRSQNHKTLRQVSKKRTLLTTISTVSRPWFGTFCYRKYWVYSESWDKRAEESHLAHSITENIESSQKARTKELRKAIRGPATSQVPFLLRDAYLLGVSIHSWLKVYCSPGIVPILCPRPGTRCMQPQKQVPHDLDTELPGKCPSKDTTDSLP